MSELVKNHRHKKNLFFISFFLLSWVSMAQKPNIVFILADDLTKYDIGAYGSPDAITPTIDALAEKGMKFNRCYQQAPTCSPTRHTIYTGLYPVRSGAYTNHTNAYNHIKSASHYLKPLGYKVGLTGKTHIAPKSVFDFEYLENKNTPMGPKAQEFLRSAAQKNESFCLFVCSNEPHEPWTLGDQRLFDPDKVTLPPHYVDGPETREQFSNYLAEINYLDGQVKETLESLEKYGLRENTVVIFASEQGNSFPFAKWTNYNAGVGSALIFNWPGKIESGISSDALVEYTDILPTVIDLAGGQPVKNLDGSSLMPIINQEKTEHKQYTYAIATTRTIYSGAEYYPIRSVADDTYRLVWNITPEMKFKNIVFKKRHFKEWQNSDNPADRAKADQYEMRPEYELYNDVKDPYNMVNLVEDPKYASKVDELKAELKRWMEYCEDEGLATELRAAERTKKEKTKQHIEVVTEMQKARNKGNIDVPLDGYYTFYISSNEEVFVDGIKIIKPIEYPRVPQRAGVIGLKKGKHQVEIKNGNDKTKLEWSGPEMKRTVCLD